MSSRFFASFGVCVVLLGTGTAGCVNRPNAAPVGQGGASGIPASQPQAAGSKRGTAGDTDPAPFADESLVPLPQAAEAHLAPDDTLGVDKAETLAAAQPTDPQASLRLALSYYKSKAYAQAAPQFVQAARLAPQNTTPLLFLGYTQMAVGALNEAQKTFGSVIVLPNVSPKDAAEANLQIGNCLWAQNKNKDAAAYFEKTLRVNPREGRASLALGTWAASQNKPDVAKTYFNTAARDLPTPHTRAQAYACLGRLAEDAKNLVDARAAYRKAVALDNDNEWAKKSLTRLKNAK